MSTEQDEKEAIEYTSQVTGWSVEEIPWKCDTCFIKVESHKIDYLSGIAAERGRSKWIRMWVVGRKDESIVDCLSSHKIYNSEEDARVHIAAYLRMKHLLVDDIELERLVKESVLVPRAVEIRFAPGEEIK